MYGVSTEAMSSFIRSRLRTFVRVCAAVSSKLPGRDDGLVTTLTKLASVYEAAEEALRGPSDPLTRFISAYGLGTHKSASFVSLFFGTTLHHMFDVRKAALSGDVTLRIAHLDGVGTIYFQEHRFNNDCADTFYHSLEFDFARVVNLLWGRARG